MRILHTLRQASVGGGESFVWNLVGQLPPEVENHFLSFQPGSLMEAMERNGIPSYCIETTTPFDPTALPRVYRLLKTLKPDLVHMHGTRAASNTLLAAKMLGIPTLYTVHAWSLHPGLGALQFHVRKQAERFIVSKATATVCGSASDLAFGEKHLGKKAQAVVHNAIPTNDQAPQDKAKVREALGIGPAAFVFLYLARNTFQKDPITLLRAFAKVSQSNPKAHLLFVGSGELDQAVEQAVEALGIADKMSRFPGTAKPAYFRAAADVFVLPSLWEAFSLAALECMAEGLPVIASDIPSNRELLQDGQAGLLFKGKSAEDLATKMQVAMDRDLEPMARKAQALVKSRYSIERLAERYYSLYQTLSAA